jgi:D-3-phosphoglycerate dehydrogenase
MKVLVADKYPEQGLAQLKAIGCEVLYKPEAKDDKLVAELKSSGADVLVVRSSKVSKEALEASRLSLVVRAGAGYNTIDVKTASQLGIFVSNCPGKNSVAVAELAFGLILSLDRRIPENVAELREGKWNKKQFGEARGLKGRTLGLIGLGSIGKEMICRAHAFGMKVVAWSRSFTFAQAEELGIEFAATPMQVAQQCDILSVHVAFKKGETEALINADVFKAMKPGTYFINTARAEVVDHAALEAAIHEKGIRAGLDVFANEPSGSTGSFADGIVKHANVYGTHHIGASTDQAQDAIAAETAAIVRSFKETGRVPNAVNIASRSPAQYILVVRHRDRVGVLAHVLAVLKENHVNVQEMENVIFEGAEAAIAKIRLDKNLQPETINAIQSGNQDILQLNLVAI